MLGATPEKKVTTSSEMALVDLRKSPNRRCQCCCVVLASTLFTVSCLFLIVLGVLLITDRLPRSMIQPRTIFVNTPNLTTTVTATGALSAAAAATPARNAAYTFQQQTLSREQTAFGNQDHPSDLPAVRNGMLTGGEAIIISDEFLLNMRRNAKRTNVQNKDKIPKERRRLDPRRTWQAFLRHTERDDANQRKRRKNAQKQPRPIAAAQLKTGLRRSSEEVTFGGSGMSRTQLISHIRQLISDAAERKGPVISCTENNCVKPTPPKPPSLSNAPLQFSWRLGHNIKIRPKKKQQLKPFYAPIVLGAFESGDGLESSEGIAHVYQPGLYLFYCTIHVTPRQPDNPFHFMRFSEPPTTADPITLSVCIDNQCDENIMSLQNVHYIQAPTTPFTLSVSGPLYLQENRNVSVWIQNGSPYTITIGSTITTFSGFKIPSQALQPPKNVTTTEDINKTNNSTK